MKIGSWKFVLASSPEAVNEMLVKKSADYAGRPQTYTFFTQSLGKLVNSKKQFFILTSGFFQHLISTNETYASV